MNISTNIYIYYIHPKLRIGDCPFGSGKGVGRLSMKHRGSRGEHQRNSSMLPFPLMSMTNASCAVLSPECSSNEIDVLARDLALIFQLEHLSIHHAVQVTGADEVVTLSLFAEFSYRQWHSGTPRNEDDVALLSVLWCQTGYAAS